MSADHHHVFSIPFDRDDLSPNLLQLINALTSCVFARDAPPAKCAPALCPQEQDAGNRGKLATLNAPGPLPTALAGQQRGVAVCGEFFFCVCVGARKPRAGVIVSSAAALVRFGWA